MSNNNNNVDLLVSTGTIDSDYADNLSEEDAAAINSLSLQEVQHIISTGHKLGKDFVQRNTGGGGHAFFF